MKQQTLNQYLKSTYKRKLYKLSLNGNCTCPNRDGTISSAGCTFCSVSGSGDFAADHFLSVTEQIEEAKKKISSKFHPDNDLPSYIAYFQSFTNTYGPIERLKEQFYEAIRHPDIAILSIATRPDCLGEDVLDLLSELNKIKPVWIELGLQTIWPQTARQINRGYPLSVYDKAVKVLQKYHIETIVHMIIGLPGETKEMMTETARYIGQSGVQGIKLQLLHVLKNTPLALQYQRGDFEVLTLEEYIDILKACIDVLPEDIIIHRLTGDGPKKLLLAPLWSGDKKRVLNAVNRALNIR